MLPLILALALQTGAPPVLEPAPAEAAEARQSSGEALELLRKIAAAQAPGQPGEQVAGFRLELVLRDFADDGTREIELMVRYRRTPVETIELYVDDNGVQVAKGFDGEDYWLRAAEAEQRTLLGGHEYKQDRDGIDQLLALCADLMLLLDIEQLEARCSGLQLGRAGEEGADRRLSGALRGSGGDWEFALFLPGESLEPRAFWLFRRVEESGEGATAELAEVQRFELRHWHDFHGRRAPRIVDVYDSLERLDAETGEETLPVRALELHDVRWFLEPKAAEAEPEAAD